MSRSRRKTRARVLIVDDHPAVREALAARIGSEPGLRVCGEAADMGEALRLLVATRPDVAVIDISLKSGSGIDLIKRIRDRDTHVRILVWSMHSESLYAQRALRAGALGYVNKDQATDVIIEAIRRVLAGKIWLSPSMSERMLQGAVGRGPQQDAGARLDTLANNELAVFSLIGEGRRTAEIAERLHLSVKTVETYRRRIRQKLKLRDSAELVRVATKWAFKQG
jgi:DNA-binding NarL/FixJ family response regulator